MAAPATTDPIPIRPVPPGTDVLPAAWSGTGLLWGLASRLSESLIRLPAAVDDLDRDFGPDLRERMARDPVIAAAERVLLTNVLNRPFQWGNPAPRTTDDGAPNPDYATAATYVAAWREAVRRLPVALETTLAEMIGHARMHGHTLAQVVTAVDRLLPGYGPLVYPARIVVKPLGAYRLVADAFWNWRGVTPAGPLWGGPYTAGGTLADGADVYDPADFALLPWNATAGDFRGRSEFTAAYGPWVQKRESEPGLLQFLSRFGQPSLKIVLPPNAPEKVTVNGVEMDLRDVFKAAGLDYQAGGVLVIPFGTEAGLEEPKGDGSAYANATRHWNGEILLALIGSTLAMLEGQHRSGTDASTHENVIAVLVRYVKRMAAEFVERALIRPFIARNFGDAAAALAPRAGLGQTAPEDLRGILQAFAQLAGPGQYWNDTVVPPDIGAALDRMADLPERQTTRTGADGVPTDTPPAPTPAPAPVAQGASA